MANKIKYGIQDVYYAKATDDGTGTLTYATPVRLPGAVNLSLSQEGGDTNFYADNILYWKGNSNNGYSGSLELARIPESFYTDILGMEVDEDGVMFEKTGTPTIEFALLFQFEGDESATRHVMYRCTATRPDVNGQTIEDSITPQTETINLTAMPRINDKYIKAKAGVDASAYATWFDAVVEPSTDASSNTNSSDDPSVIDDGE